MVANYSFVFDDEGKQFLELSFDFADLTNASGKPCSANFSFKEILGEEPSRERVTCETREQDFGFQALFKGLTFTEQHKIGMAVDRVAMHPDFYIEWSEAQKKAKEEAENNKKSEEGAA